MTVIAYKNQRMACDSLCADTESGAIWYKGNKIVRTKAGALIGCSGCADSRAVVELLKNVKRGAQMPTAAALAATHCESENGILVALPDGEVWCIIIVSNEDGDQWSSDCCKITGLGGMAVAGCGGREALAFMRAGKSAKEACALVCEVNSFCRPPIYEEVLHPPKKQAKRRARK